jgi:arylsulfatase A-like enzyme
LGVVGRWRAGTDAARWQTHDARARVCTGELDIPAAALERMHHLYNRSVSSMDHWVGDLVDDLDRSGRLADTVVVVTSDHGENFGEGHLVGHLLSVDDRLIRVPFVVAGPDKADLGDGPFSLVRLPALVANLLGIDDHPWSDVGPGPAVAQTDGLATWDEEARERLVAAWNLPSPIVDRLASPIACATDGRFKLVRESGRHRLYDTSDDPLEGRDVSDSHPDQVKRLQTVLDAAEPLSPTADRAPESGAHDNSTTRDLEDRMRLLGYL